MKTRFRGVRISWCATLAGALLLGAVATPASGQRPGAIPMPQRAELQQRVQQRFDELVRAQLDLTEAQAERVRELARDFQEQRQALGQRHRALRSRLRSVDLEWTEAEAQVLLDELTAVHRAEADLIEAELNELREVLTAAQVARFHALRQQLMERIERRREGFPGARRGPPGGVR